MNFWTTIKEPDKYDRQLSDLILSSEVKVSYNCSEATRITMAFLFLLEFAVAPLICALVLLYCIQMHNHRKMPDIPTPPMLPIIGHALYFGRTTADIFNAVIHIVDNYGSLTRVWLGPFKQTVAIADPKGIELILTSNKLIDKSEEYDFLWPWLGLGLLTSTGEKWRKRRKMLTPSFHFKILEQSADIFSSAGAIMIEKLKQKCNGPAFDVYPFVTLCSLDVISEAAMGIKINAQVNSEDEYVLAVRNICNLVHLRMFSVWRRIDFVYQLSSEGQLFKKSLGTLHGMTLKVINERRNLLVESQSDRTKHNEEIDIGLKKRYAFLDMLLSSTIDDKPLSDDDIREEVDTFMFEGHDTVSSAIGFALYLLSNHPDVQQKLFDETREIIGDDPNKTLSFADLQSMKYIELVLKEVLRLYPSVPMFGRRLAEDITIQNHRIIKGMDVILLPYMMHRNPDIFPEPTKFDPERFSRENIHSNPFVYVPFSAGARNCIGQKFAMLEMKSIISNVLRHYELLPAGPEYDLNLVMALVLKSTNGVNIKLRPRKY